MIPTPRELHEKAGEYTIPVVIKHRTEGYAYFVAHIYKIPKASGKGHEWWILEHDTQTVKRMDTY